MIDWKYSNPQKNENKKINEGRYRLRVADVIIEPETIDKPYDSIKFIYDVSGESATAWNRIKFNRKDPDKTNRFIRYFGKCLNVSDREMANPNRYRKFIGKFCAGYIVNDFGNRVDRFILPQNAEDLPDWEEPLELDW